MTFISILIEIAYISFFFIFNEMVYDDTKRNSHNSLQYAPKAINATCGPDGSQPYFMFVPVSSFLSSSQRLQVPVSCCAVRVSLIFLLDALPVHRPCMCVLVLLILTCYRLFPLEEDPRDTE